VELVRLNVKDSVSKIEDVIVVSYNLNFSTRTHRFNDSRTEHRIVEREINALNLFLSLYFHSFFFRSF